MQKFKSLQIVFSAPSGTGKTTIVKKLLKKYPQLTISVSATTRPQRHDEVNGDDYIFMTHEAFTEAIRENLFLEYEEVHGNLYGTPRNNVDQQVGKGVTVLFDIDVKGAKAIKLNYPKSILIFIKPPSKEALINRLKNRNSETPETIQRRLERLNYEYEQSSYFDYIVINDDLNHAINEVEKIILNHEDQ